MPQEEAPLTFRTAVVDSVIDEAVSAARADPRPCIVIDGRSGSGKTTMAHRIADRVGARVVSLDEFYPGWSGLAEGSRIAAELVRAHADARAGQYRRWDWQRHDWRAATESVDPARPLVIEGCGALTPASASDATVTVWLDGDAAARYDIAIARDGEGFRAHWREWARQEDAHIGRHDPRALAHLAADVC